MYVHTHRDRCCDWGHIKDIVLLFMFYVYAFPCGWLPQGNSIFSWASAAHHHFNMAVVDLVGRHSNLTPPQQPCQITPSPFISPHIYIYFFFFWIPSCCSSSNFESISLLFPLKKSRCAHKILLTSFFRPLVVLLLARPLYWNELLILYPRICC